MDIDVEVYNDNTNVYIGQIRSVINIMGRSCLNAYIPFIGDLAIGQLFRIDEGNAIIKAIAWLEEQYEKRCRLEEQNDKSLWIKDVEDYIENK